MPWVHKTLCSSHDTARMAAGDEAHQRLLVCGLWGGLTVLDLADPSRAPHQIAALEDAWRGGPHNHSVHGAQDYPRVPDGRRASVSMHHSSFKGKLGPTPTKVRCLWISDDGRCMAYGVEHRCVVRSFEHNDGARQEPMRLVAEDKVSSVWGSSDCQLLLTGHFSLGCALVWCLVSGRCLRKIQCNGCVKDMCGFGSLLASGAGVTVAVGCNRQMDSAAMSNCVSLFNISLPGAEAGRPYQFVRALSASSANSQVAVALSQEQLIDPDDLCIEHRYSFPTNESVNCLLTSGDGRLLIFGGRGHFISIYRLDALALCGPSLKMLQRSSDVSLDITHHNALLGPLLMEGTLTEWLLQSEQDEALTTLLHYRPSASLLPLPDGTSTFETVSHA